LVARWNYLLELIPKLLPVDRETPVRLVQDQNLRYRDPLLRDQLLYEAKGRLIEDTTTQHLEAAPKKEHLNQLSKMVSEEEIEPFVSDKLTNRERNSAFRLSKPIKIALFVIAFCVWAYYLFLIQLMPFGRASICHNESRLC
jgi:hypothetical protein